MPGFSLATPDNLQRPISTQRKIDLARPANAFWNQGHESSDRSNAVGPPPVLASVGHRSGWRRTDLDVAPGSRRRNSTRASRESPCPTEAERKTCVAFLQEKRNSYADQSVVKEGESDKQADSDLFALRDLSLAIMNTNEFIYLD